MSDNAVSEQFETIAIVGMTGRFPGARDLETFWRNLRQGVEARVSFSEEELEAAGVDPVLRGQPHYVRAGFPLEGPELFDAAFFGFNPREAELLDPQHRLFLECAWEALERAGYDAERHRGAIAVFASSSISSYLLYNLMSQPEVVRSAGPYALLLANDKDFLATRVSHKLNLRGPSISVQTACSSSLVAVHLACQSLLSGESDMALAGGVSISFPQRTGYAFQEGSILSPDGHCRAFDAQGQGTVAGSGVGVVVLKRMSDALKDGDFIHAVIRGSALNNDGSGKVGYTAPSAEGQAGAISEALAVAGVSASSIQYVEAHGTGTRLGDPIEIAGLTQAYKDQDGGPASCAIGSVKTNIGHLDAAAGVTGLIKTALALQHRQMPPSLHFREPNPGLGLERSPFYVNSGLREWPASDEPRRAGVSSFGIGGTNAHAILEEAPAVARTASARPWQLLVLSARSATALEQATGQLAEHLSRNPELELADVAFTLQAGRQRFAHRRAVVCRGLEDARAVLSGQHSQRLLTQEQEATERPVTFLFPGQGSQHVGMARGLYASESVFRQNLDACCNKLRPHLGLDLRELIHAPEERAAEATEQLQQTALAQPALFAIEYALARMWISLGVKPQALIGHSLGEYVAASIAGVMSLDDALALVAARGKLMQSLPGGTMLSVALPEQQVLPLLGERLSLAAVNAPSLCVVSGPTEAIAALEARLAPLGVEHRRLRTSHAFHSAMMDPILAAFTERVRQVKLSAPKIPFISNLSGTWITAEQAVDPRYWTEHLRRAVRFGDGVTTLLASPQALLLEVGPGQALGMLVRQAGPAAVGRTVLSTLPRARDEQPDSAAFLETLGRMWLAGVQVDWAKLHAPERRQRLPLPTYPFQRQRYFIEQRRVLGGTWAEPTHARGHEDAQVQQAAPEAKPSSGRHQRPALANAYEAPRDGTERAVATLWEEMLGIEGIGLHDNFFELGGHSLLATQIASRVRTLFQVEVPLRELLEHPTVAGLSGKIDAARGAGLEHPADVLPRATREGALPLASAQQRLWFFDKLEPGTSLYNIPVVVRLEGTLDTAALERGLAELVRRHESLRTTFVSRGGEPSQVISPSLELPLARVDLSATSEAGRAQEAHQQVQHEALRPFDLAQGPLVRALLLKLAEREHVLVLTMHHIISDGWSLGVLVRELGALYASFSKGQPSPLAELAVQYVDYAAWQRDKLQGERFAQELGWWREQLAGVPHALELPTDRPRPPLQTYRGASLTQVLPRELSEALKTLGQKENATPFMVLQAAFQVLLHRYSGQEDICVGSPIAGRTRPELEGLIGLFVNMLVLRARPSGHLSFRELLAQVRQTTLDAYAHQDVPFEKLVEELQPQRDLSRSPLFQVMFVVQNAPMPDLVLPELKLRPMAAEGSTAKFDLTVTFTEQADGFRTELEYNTDLYEAATARRMLGHLQTLLQGIVAEPGQRLSRLPMLTAEERQRVLVDWNATALPRPEEARLHLLVEQQVDRTPDAPAVTYEGQSLTYRELDQRANQLAHHLLSLGVGPEVPVGVCTDRSIEMVVALLGILKAGGAYVPIDPSYPQDRLAYMLQDSRVPVLLTQQHLVEHLPASSATRVCLDSQWSEVAARGTARLNLPLHPRGLAYIIYTSGSTGRPKGAMNFHQAICNRLLWMQEAYGLGAQDSVLQKTPFSFDVSVWEFFWTLMTGARLVVAKPGGHQDPAYLVNIIQQERITTLHFVPSMLQAFLEQPGVEQCRGIKRVICSGEALGVEHAERFHGKLNAELHNLYGPTEAAVDVTFWQCMPGDKRRSIPIGRPVSNTQMYVLDGQMNPVPVGVSGELYIGGVQPARGYWGRPELTAEKFIPDPYASEPGARLYRTGDLARFLAGGEIEYLGRIDNQVKVRGFRIELGEIESALLQHPAVKEAVVVAREDVPGDKRLVAYLVAQPEQTISAGDLRSALKQMLPEYMVPSAMVVLDKLPLSPNGKVDRKALPAPERPQATQEYVAPRNETERLLTQLWAEVLRVPRVGIHDNFFELGGHSLLATQVLSRVSAHFGVDLPLRELFQSSTVAALAGKLEVALRSERRLQLPPLRALPRGESEPPLSFAQQRLWFLDQLEPGSPLYNIALAVRLEGALDVSTLERSLAELLRRHEALRTIFPARSGQPVQVITHTPALLRTEDLKHLPEAGRMDEARRLALEEAQRPFDLGRGPLLRATLLSLAEREHVLLLTMHHIVSDDWTMAVLLQEAAAIYEAFLVGRPSPLPEPPVQYVDFAAWQRGWLQGELLEQQLAWWRNQLQGAPRALELPTDRPRPAVQSFRGAHQTVVMPRALMEAVQALSQREGATPNMVLLAAYQTLLHRLSGQLDLSVGSPIAGRNHAELERLVGCFVNTLVLRTRLTPEQTFRELLAQVREVVLEGLAHQDVPFERLVEELRPERDPSRSPLFQVMFVMQNVPRSALTLPGLSLRPLEATWAPTAKFDLTLTFTETPHGLHTLLEYNTDLFDHGTATRLLEQMRTLLEGIVAHPEQQLRELPLLSEAERRQLLVDWNATRVDYPREATIPSLFEAQVERTPDAVAVEYEGQTLTYRALNSRANQLAHHLRGFGVGPESRVGLCVARSLELVVGILGILKAGGTYVPLDPSYPADRLSFMLQDTGVMVIVTQEDLADELPAQGSLFVCLDADWAQVQAQPENNLSSGITADNVAYIMYTSGSTGRPKGVCVPHRGVVRLVQGSTFIDMGPQEVFLQLAPISFDASTLELWGALLHGAKLVVYPAGTPSLEELGAKLVHSGITTLWLTAALFEQMQATQPEALRGVRQLLAGGDVLPVGRVKERLAYGGLVVNGYGPTENTTFTCCYPMRDVSQVGHSVSIGKPIASTQVYLLDASMQPVPVGVAGELYTGGDGLAAGYLNRPELTAEKFVPHPFSTEPGARLYRTGDLARYLPDGRIEFLGRIDNQVKVRGFRIELGEIESVLAGHAQVRETTVLVREDVPGDKRLVAYVVAKDAESPPDTSALRAWMKERLPEYMVPPAYVVLDAMPLSPNGKVDRKALPAPDGSPSDKAGFEAPRTDTEVKLADIWRSLLGLERVGLSDDFFELGGHSLLATQVVVRIREAFQLELPLRELFDTPTLAGLAGRIDASRGSSPVPQAAPLTRVSREGPLPLSFAQQRLWFLDQLEPGSAFYNIPVMVRMEGQLDEAALERSFEELVRRHESLRTVFREEQGQPVQVIAPEARLPLAVVDLWELPAGEREAEVRRQVEAEVRRPFDLKRGPLLRPMLLRQEEHVHLLMLTMHHVVSDGWSMGVLVREMAALYEAHVQGKPSPLPELPVQYADYAAWQRDWLQGDVLAQQLGYWRKQLSGAPHALTLPTDKPRPAVMTSRGASLTAQLPFELSKALEALGHEAGATPFMVLLTAFQVLLSRHSGQEDICVGSPIAGRGRSEVEGLIGFFVNTLVLRTRLSPTQSFRELLAQVKETTLGAYAHQDVPFEKLVEELKPERDQSRTPLVQVVFGLQNAPLPELKLPGLKLRAIEPESQTSKFDLTMSVAETPAGFSMWLEYNTDLYEASTARRLLEQLQVLLEGIAAAPDRQLQELSLLGEAERRQLLVDWNATRVDYPREATIPSLFEAQVERTPDAVAVEYEGQTLTYRALNSRANQLAHHLRASGVGPESRVGLSLERSLELVVGILGILKAGGTYVPLDASYPADRLSFILQDTGVKLIVTQKHLASRLPAQGSSFLCLDADWAQVQVRPEDNLSSGITADNVAYIMYTSGSTGRPKGVCVPHRGVVRLVQGSTFIDMGPQEVFLQLAPISFDASTLELWGALLHGAKLVVYPAGTPSLEELGAKLVRSGITTLWLTAALFEQMQATQPEALRGVRQLLAGGDVLPVGRVKERLAQGGLLVNGYGPTENTTFTCCHPMRDVSQVGHSVSIGKPIASTQVYLLDASMQPVPVGVAGELYTGGDGLAAGYLNRPELTAEKFVPHPFSTEPGARLYRTGDLARYLPDGRIEFLGRIDNQVKVRGFRIELGEIESVLAQHESVRECTVVVREDVPGDKRLVAYVVAKNSAPETTALRAWMKERLPEYMVPLAYVVLDAMPLSPNGKVDRKALPVPERQETGREYEAPRNDTERILTELWAEVLGVERVGIHDNFFDLGGHSLLATQALSRIRSTFQVELPLRDFFGEPTVANAAVRILNEQASQVDTAELERMMAELDQLSGEETEALLSNAQPDASTKKVSSNE